MPHQPGIPRLPLIIEDRVCNAMEAIMGEVDWWMQSSAWPKTLGELLDLLRVSSPATQPAMA